MPTGKILCLGDSLTAGSEGNATGYRSYRGALQQLLATGGYTIDFVGTQYSVPATGGSDGDHDGYGGARMMSADDAGNSIEGRVSTIRTAVGAVDVIILLIGWNDVYSGTSSVATKHASLLNTIQSGTWSTAKIVMVTMSPEPNKTAAQTGSDYPVYASLNAAIRSAASATRVVADLAGATTSSSSDRDAMVEKLLYDVKFGPEVTQRADGSTMPAVKGGHQITSFKSIQDYNAQWRQTPWRVGGNGNTSNDLASSPSVIGHPYFVNTVHSIVPWLWVHAAAGHASTNTVVEARNLFAQALRGSTGQWEFFFEGARPGAAGNVCASYNPNSLSLYGYRPDGITSYYRVSGGANIEAWSADTVPSRGITNFSGGANRSLMADAQCFCIGVQVRLALLDPNGTNDIAQSRYIVGCGFDAYAGASSRYDYWGWPFEMMDGGHDRYQVLNSTQWITLGALSIGRTSASWGGVNDTEHYEDPGCSPPHSQGYEFATPFNDLGTYSRTPAQIRANPPRLPRYWVTTGSTGSDSAWVPEDYWFNPQLGARDIHWSQQGADRAARIIYDALVQSGFLLSFGGGGGGGGGEPIITAPLPGVGSQGSWTTRFDTEATDPDTATWRLLDDAAVTSPPAWGAATILPFAVVGTAYSAQLLANGSPVPTFSIVSGAPAWLACSSGGALTGTPTGGAASHLVTFRATSSAGAADATLALSVVVAPTITTTSLPNGAVGVAYSQALSVTGAGPFTWAVQTGALPAGLSLSAGGVISGTPTGTASASFTLRATGAGGLYDDQPLTLAVTASGQAPTITTTSLADAIVGLAHSASIATTGSTPKTFSIIAGSLPPGLSLNASTGAITGTPTVVGGYVFTVRVSNAYSPPAEAQLSLRVLSQSVTVGVSPWTAVLKGR